MELARHPLDKCGECSRIPRSQIREASYNPRVITPEQKRRLKRGMEKHGLCTPLVWNKTSGVLVGGHQRLSVLDSLCPEKEWAVPVTIQELSEERERELNILLNNDEASGHYDLGKLGSMFKDFKLDIESTGFDPAKLKTLIPSVAVQIPAVNEQLAVNKQHWQDAHKKTQARQDAAIDRMAERAKDFSPQTTEIAKSEDRAEAGIYETDDLFYIPFVLPDLMTAARLKEMMGLPPESRDQDGRILMQIVQEWAELKAKNRQ